MKHMQRKRMRRTELDKTMAAIYKRNPSYSYVSRLTGVHIQRVTRRIIKMRLAGYKLPELQPIGVSTWKTRRRKKGTDTDEL